jgi:SWI/SNF-related matrix-associated actin-dependent regulator 1 of chromatin subfamily A
MIKIENIKGFTALNKLRGYDGKNPYLKKLKNELVKNGKLPLTTTQEEYIISNFEFEPHKVDRVIGISEYLGEEFKKKYELSFTPTKIYIGFVLGENEKSFHVFGKLKQNQKQNEMYWVPKTQVMEDPYYTPVDIDVDFDKYTQKDLMGRTPYEHQKEGIKFLLSRKKAILADDMGLGKTIQAVVSTLATESKKVLIICPSSTKINWEREINMFGEYDTSIIQGRKWKPAKYTIINYDILKNFHTVKKRGEKPIEELTQILDEKFDTLIVDEAHYLKNHKSIRGSIVTDLVKKTDFENVWLLTGTPVANRPKDLYNLLKIIGHPLADNWQFYVKRYCDAKNFKKRLKNGKIKNIWLVDGNSNLGELSIRIKNKVLRRMKEEVLDMPDKTIIPVFNQLSSKEWVEYDNLWEEYLIKRKEQKKRGSPQRDLVELILLRQFIAMKAMPNTIELVDNAIEEDKKVIIFTTFNDELLDLQEYYGNKCVVHNGSMSSNDKQHSVDEFQNNPNKKVFIGNIMSAGVGITLTAADTVVFNSFDWVPGNNEQAEDRSYRIGQKNNVSVYYQLFDDTISTRMWYTLKHKKNVINQIIGKNDDNIDEIVNDIIE